MALTDRVHRCLRLRCWIAARVAVVEGAAGPYNLEAILKAGSTDVAGFHLVVAAALMAVRIPVRFTELVAVQFYAQGEWKNLPKYAALYLESM